MSSIREPVEAQWSTETGEGTVPRMFVLVGLPCAGKTSRARQLASTWNALRLTPDEWMIPLFGQEQPEGKRNVVEGRLIWLALSALRTGVSVVLDFGVWARVERSALRALAASVGATSELVYLPVDEEEQWRRVQARTLTDTATSFEMTKADLDRWRPIFQPPDSTELDTTDIDLPPTGFESWEAWVAQWWPTSLPDRGSPPRVLGYSTERDHWSVPDTRVPRTVRGEREGIDRVTPAGSTSTTKQRQPIR